MPRSSRSSSPARSSGWGRSSSARIVPDPVPMPAPAPTLGQSIKEGFGWGIGTSIAQRLFGPPCQTVVVQQAPPPAPVGPPTAVGPKYLQEFEQCMRESNNDREACKQFLT